MLSSMNHEIAAEWVRNKEMEVVQVLHQSPDIENLAVPDELQNRGASSTELFVFRKVA